MPAMADEAFINRVRERVEALQEGPVTLALKGGLERNFIRDLLSGDKKSVRSNSIAKLAAALHCDPEWLASGKLSVQSAREQKLLRLWRHLPEMRQDAFLALIEDVDGQDEPQAPSSSDPGRLP